MNLTLVLITLLLIYVCVLQTLIFLKQKEVHQYLPLDAGFEQHFKYNEPILKIDSKTGEIQKLEKLESGYRWVKY